MVGESWDVFTKRVLVEKHLVVSCVKIQGAPCPSLPTPMCNNVSVFFLLLALSIACILFIYWF